MKITVLAFIASLLAASGASISDELQKEDIVSCKKFFGLLKEVTHNKCNPDSLKISICEDALDDLPAKKQIELALRSKKCSDDLELQTKQNLEDQILDKLIADILDEPKKKTKKPVNIAKKNATKIRRLQEEAV